MPPVKPRSSGVRLKDGFTSGSVVRINLVNFMTYNSFEFRPGPRMNVIVGPNGTGKSTLLCAICLGLGGKPANVGRASAVGDYVKHGCQVGSVEIELCNIVGENYVIFREIHRDNHSTWKLNNQPTTIKKVEELMVTLNIQMKNLCQFLPQDRVAEFVKMTPQQLLESTEKAAGDPEMWENHSKLKNCQATTQELHSTVARLQEELSTEMQQKLRLEERVKTYKAREGHMSSIEYLEKKKSWVEYQAAKEQFTFANATKDRKVKELEQSQEKVKPLLMAQAKIEKTVNALEQKMKVSITEVRNRHRNAVEKLQTIEKLSEKSTEIIEEHKGKAALEEQRQTRLKTLQQQLQTIHYELENLPQNDQEAHKLDVVNARMREHTETLNRLQEEIANHSRTKRAAQQEHQNAQAEATRLQDVRKLRMDILRQKNRDAFAATTWLQENRALFKKTIHEPIMTAVNLKIPKWAKYFEMHIPFKDMVAFICEDPDDMELFVTNLREQRNLRINVAMAPSVPSSSFQPNTPLRSLEKWGFHSYLKDVIDAPEAILSYLCRQYRIHDIAIGTEETKRNIERVLNECPRLNVFYTDNHQYRTSVSKYGDRGRSTSCMQLSPATLLNANLDVARVEELKNNLLHWSQKIELANAAIQRLQEEEQTLNVAMEALRIEKKELTRLRDMRKHLLGKIDTKKQSIRACEDERVDLEKEKQDAYRKLLKVAITRGQKLEEHQSIVKAWFDCTVERTILGCKHACSAVKKNQITKELKECNANMPALEQEVAICKENVLRLKNKAKTLYDLAKKKTGSKDNNLTPALYEKFATLPDTLEELENEIRTLQAQVDCIQHTDYDNSLEEYQRWQTRTNMLEKNFRLKSIELENYRTGIETLHDRWLTPLKNLLRQVNTRFSEYFKSLGCSGEVDISTGDNERDYERYGISIRVTYRVGEPLRELTQHYQSGGERSVATILYLLALQEFIKLPFCCVDEINQGMDSTNERRVFQLMAQTVCTANLAQYFLLTPKLLPNMEFDKNVMVHAIVNGKMSNNDVWNNLISCEKRTALDD